MYWCLGEYFFVKVILNDYCNCTITVTVCPVILYLFYFTNYRVYPRYLGFYLLYTVYYVYWAARNIYQGILLPLPYFMGELSLPCTLYSMDIVRWAPEARWSPSPCHVLFRRKKGEKTALPFCGIMVQNKPSNS